MGERIQNRDRNRAAIASIGAACLWVALLASGCGEPEAFIIYRDGVVVTRPRADGGATADGLRDMSGTVPPVDMIDAGRVDPPPGWPPAPGTPPDASTPVDATPCFIDGDRLYTTDPIPLFTHGALRCTAPPGATEFDLSWTQQGAPMTMYFRVDSAPSWTPAIVLSGSAADEEETLYYLDVFEPIAAGQTLDVYFDDIMQLTSFEVVFYFGGAEGG